MWEDIVDTKYVFNKNYYKNSIRPCYDMTTRPAFSLYGIEHALDLIQHYSSACAPNSNEEERIFEWKHFKFTYFIFIQNQSKVFRRHGLTEVNDMNCFYNTFVGCLEFESYYTVAMFLGWIANTRLYRQDSKCEYISAVLFWLNHSNYIAPAKQ